MITEEAVVNEMIDEAEHAGNGEYPDSWRPEAAGEKLVGFVVGFDEVESQYPESGPTVQIVEMEALGSRKRWALWLTGRVLKEEWAAKKPVRGDLVAVLYHGEKKSKAGRRFQHYAVSLRRLADLPPALAEQSRAAVAGDGEAEEEEELSDPFDPNTI